MLASLLPLPQYSQRPSLPSCISCAALLSAKAMYSFGMPAACESNVFFHWALSIVSLSPSLLSVCAVPVLPRKQCILSLGSFYRFIVALCLRCMYLYCRESNVFFHWALCIVSFSPSVCALPVLPRKQCILSLAWFLSSPLAFLLTTRCVPVLWRCVAGHDSNVFFWAPRFLASCCPILLTIAASRPPSFALALVYFYEVVCSSNSFFLGCTLFCYPACVSQRSVG